MSVYSFLYLIHIFSSLLPTSIQYLSSQEYLKPKIFLAYLVLIQTESKTNRQGRKDKNFESCIEHSLLLLCQVRVNQFSATSGFHSLHTFCTKIIFFELIYQISEERRGWQGLFLIKSQPLSN